MKKIKYPVKWQPFEIEIETDEEEAILYEALRAYKYQLVGRDLEICEQMINEVNK